MPNRGEGADPPKDDIEAQLERMETEEAAPKEEEDNAIDQERNTELNREYHFIFPKST